jgi:hemerythrin-like domain-containing protein
MATTLLMSHHGLRRDIARFAIALDRIAHGDLARVDAVRQEWQHYHSALRFHHQAEDLNVFPYLLSAHASLASTIEQLSVDHRRLDPLVESGDRAFAKLPKVEAAARVVTEIMALLDAHLALEEAELIPFLRDVKHFAPSVTDEQARMWAEGVAWCLHGIAPEVVQRVQATLPQNVKAKLALAREEVEARFEHVWGSTDAGASFTARPER